MSTEPLTLRAVGDEPDAEVVEKLKNWLKLAESGELRSLLLVGELVGPETKSGSAGSINVPDAVWKLKVIERHLMNRWVSGGSDSDINYEDED